MGLGLVFVSSEHKEAVMSIILVTLLVHNFPRSWLNQCHSTWWVLLFVLLLNSNTWNLMLFISRLKKFPPKTRLLTEDEYIDQGRIETVKALEELRRFSKSPDCNAWKTMSRLKDPLRFFYSCSYCAFSCSLEARWMIDLPKTFAFCRVLVSYAFLHGFWR